MLYTRQLGWKGCIQQVQDSVGLVALPFPKKIVMVGDGVYTQFGNQPCQAHPQGHVHRNCQSVLNDDQVQAIITDKFPQWRPQLICKGVDLVAELFAVLLRRFLEGPFGQGLNGAVSKM